MVKVEKDPEEPEDDIILAANIILISDAMQKLLRSGLKEKAIVALLQDDTKLGKGVIETVLASLKTLAKNYTDKE